MSQGAHAALTPVDTTKKKKKKKNVYYTAVISITAEQLGLGGKKDGEWRTAGRGNQGWTVAAAGGEALMQSNMSD